jgi:hypothetical protein
VPWRSGWLEYTGEFMWKNVLLVAVAVLFGIVALEVALRVMDPFHFRSGWRSQAESEFQKPPKWTTNQLGFHGAPIEYTDADKVVLLVGDSQVECGTCREDPMPEYFLKREYEKLGRPVKVVTLGAAGYGADQELLAVREYFRKGYRANLILLWQTLGNDLWNNLFPRHSVAVEVGHLKPTFRVQGDKLVEPDSSIGSLYCGLYLDCLKRQFMDGGIERSYVDTLPPAVQPVGEPQDSRLPILDTAEDVADEKTHWSIWLKPDSPRKLYGIRLFNLLEKEMEATAHAHGASFFVFDIDRYTPEGIREIEQFDFFKPTDKFVRAKGKYYLAGGQIEYFKVSAQVNQGLPMLYIPVTIPDHVISVQDPHLNARGNSHVMAKLAEATATKL